jgi:hypothetical protein
MLLSRRMLLETVVFGFGGALATLVLIGVPTALFPTPWFGRAIPPHPLDYVILGFTALLAAGLAATYALPVACPTRERTVTAGGLLSFFAVGCPVCNKIVVLAVGASGAMSYFAPIQPLIAIVSMALLGYAIWLRARSIRTALDVAGFAELQQSGTQ